MAEKHKEKYRMINLFESFTFSAMSLLKSKHRNRLNVEHDLRLSLSNIKPQMQDLVGRKQSHSSH